MLFKKGNVWRKGKQSHRKGLTIIEEYGIERANEIKRKMSLKKIGCIPWNKGMVGMGIMKAWNKGKKNIYSKATLKKMSEKKIGSIPWIKGKKGIYGGKNHWNWKGGITPQRRILRTSIKWKNWRKKIFERDNFECVSCGIKSSTTTKVYLHPHHIIPISKDELHSFDIMGGLTLCKLCHLNKELGLHKNIPKEVI